MKRRLPTPPTDEDCACWAKLLSRAEVYYPGTLWKVSLDCDRRDADLMFLAMLDPSCSVVLVAQNDRLDGAIAVDVRGVGDKWCPF